MTRRFRLTGHLEQAAMEHDDPLLLEAAERLERAEAACDRVREYLRIRGELSQDIGPGWSDLDAIGSFVRGLPEMGTESEAAEAQEVEA